MLQPRLSQKPIHILFFHTDHFEPSHNHERVRRWEEEYPKFAGRHRDSSGRPLQHTAFYPGEQAIEEQLLILQRLARAGYAEVELQVHHHWETHETAREQFQSMIAYFQEFGFLKTVDGQTRFGFVHGNYGLDNSRGPAFCGVNRELSLLRELGCFADFTFPGLWQEAQPSSVNTIYEATDDDGPKSYDRGVPLQVGRQPGGDLVIFPGPLMVRFTSDPRRLFFTVVDADIHPTVAATKERVDSWIRANIHVQGRPDWLFVKVHGHAVSSQADMDEHLGPNFDQALSYLEQRYNDGTNYVLHYVTAREAYNLARAAAANQQGDPTQYLNWEVKPYIANSVIAKTGCGQQNQPARFQRCVNDGLP